MKAILSMMMFLFSFASFGQGAILSQVNKKPEILTLKNYKAYGALSARIMYVEKDEKGQVYTGVTVESSPSLMPFRNYLLTSDFEDVLCDGDFSLERDERNMQVIFVKSLNVCISEDDGQLIAHSVGRSMLSKAEFDSIVAKLESKRKGVAPAKSINQSESVKETRISLPGLARDGAGSAQ